MAIPAHKSPALNYPHDNRGKNRGKALETNSSNRPFIVVSGLPASGKSTLGRQLAIELNLPFLDKDDFLRQQFESEGVGDIEWRRKLSRKSDELFRQATEESTGAVLVSWWRLRGMSNTSGTPTDWLYSLSDRIVQVHCNCDVEIAARRFYERKRHLGHLDSRHSLTELIESTTHLSKLETFTVGTRLDVDTDKELDLELLVARIRSILSPAQPGN